MQTRSSAQARSHSQKVLRKMDKNAIMREIIKLKAKLKFDPKEHKCENLSVLSCRLEDYSIYLPEKNKSAKFGNLACKNKREIKISSNTDKQILNNTKL